jgi:hypothetical protein
MMNVKRLNLIFTSILLLLTLATTVFVGVSFAWFTEEEQVTYTGQMGFVDVDIDVYFEDEFNNRTEAEEVQMDTTSKPGVFRINITSNTADYFIEDLRVDLIIKSNIDTYFRVEIYEQLTFIYEEDGVLNEMTVPYTQGVNLNYNFTNWYDNRIFDNYIYYMNSEKRINETTPLVIPLIDSYFAGQSFDTRSPGYSLQMAFSVEAVQADGGPQNNWDFATPPWGGSW